MDDLLKIISSVDYEDFGSLQLLEVKQRDENLYLVLDVNVDEEPTCLKEFR
jgi:hypothetical protein